MSGDTEREALTEVVRRQAAKGQYLVAGEDHPYMVYARSVADAILAEFLPAHDKRVRVEYETRRRPDPIHVDNIDGVNATAWLAEHDAELTERVRAEQREVDALTVLNAPLDSHHRRILRRDLAAAIREASDD